MKRRALTAAERQVKSVRMRELWASGHFANRKHTARGDTWQPSEDAVLRELAGTLPLDDLAAALSERTGMARTAQAVRIRAKRLSVSLWCACLGLGDLERIFRLDHRAITRHWLETGLLPSKRWAGRGPNAGWWIEPADVERFIRECAWAYDWRRVQPGRWRRLAEVAQQADPWRHYSELAAYVELAEGNLDKWRRRGLVPTRRRPKGGGAWLMVRGRDFPTIKATIQQAQGNAREQARRTASDRFRFGPRDANGKILPGAWRAA